MISIDSINPEIAHAWLAWALAPSALTIVAFITIKLAHRFRRTAENQPTSNTILETKPHPARHPTTHTKGRQPTKRRSRPDRHADAALESILQHLNLSDDNRRTLTDLAAVTHIHPAALLLNEPTFRRAALASARSGHPRRPDPRAVLALGIHAFPGRHTPPTKRPPQHPPRPGRNHQRTNAA